MKMQITGRSAARLIVLGITATILAGCETGGQIGRDSGIDGGALQDGVANIWVDPDGCQHWYIDDGIEGYMSPRLNRDGTPYCQDNRGALMTKDGQYVPVEGEPMRPAT